MVFYWLNLESVPTNFSSLAYADTSSTLSYSPNENLGNNWPFSGPPVTARRLKAYEDRKYKTLVLGTNAGPWYGGKKLLLLTNTLFPNPYAAAPPKKENTVPTEFVTALQVLYKCNLATLSPFGYRFTDTKDSLDRLIIPGISFDWEEVFHIENDQSVRELGVFPGKAGDQYDFKGTCGDTAITYGEPQIIAVFRHHLTDLYRPFHFFNADGSVFDPSSSPFRDNFLMYNGNMGFSNKPSVGNTIPNNGLPGYFLDKTSEMGASFWEPGRNPGDCPYPGNSVATGARIVERTKFYPESINIAGNTIMTSTLLSTAGLNEQIGEHYFKTGQNGYYNEQHMSWNMITSYVALTGDYMIEDEFQFMIIPELALYRPWCPVSPTANLGASKEGRRYPGGGEREFGRKLLCYTQAMRVTTGRVFQQLYALAKTMIDVVENTFRVESNNYQNEQAFGNICYTVSYGDRGTNSANRIFNFNASTVYNNLTCTSGDGGITPCSRVDFWLPWQQAYTLRSLEAFTKYNGSQKYRDTLLRLCRTLFLFGVYKEKEIMPANRNGVYNTLAASAPAMWAGAYKFANYMKLVFPEEVGSNGAKYAPLVHYTSALGGPSYMWEADWMYYLGRVPAGSTRPLMRFNIRPFMVSCPRGLTGANCVNYYEAQRGLIPPTVPFTNITMPEFSGTAEHNISPGGIYGDARTHFGWTVSAGFSGHPTLGGYIVSGIIPQALNLPDTTFSTEFNRVLEHDNGYITWLAPAAQVVLNTVLPGDELRFPRILEARATAEDLINKQCLGPAVVPSGYRTLLGFDTPDIENAPEVPPITRVLDYDLVSQFLVHRSIP